MCACVCMRDCIFGASRGFDPEALWLVLENIGAWCCRKICCLLRTYRVGQEAQGQLERLGQDLFVLGCGRRVWFGV